MISSLVVALLAAQTFATPIEQRATAPSVTIQHGTVVGSSSNGVDSFNGIPYAKPPVGNLRLRPPQSLTAPFGTLTATATPTACPQMNVMQYDPSNLPSSVVTMIEDSPLFQNLTTTGEDCLTVNVQRPSTANGTSKLPVLFWIYGGGFETGSTQSYDASEIIQKSVSLNEPIVYVAVNYRLNAFGFLAGKELSAQKSTNLGLRDQRLGLQWVQQNIAAFGGDPSRVTIWGESAGSISVFNQLLINNGVNTFNGKRLFRGAIMDSGTSVSADNVLAPQAQEVYDTVVKNAGCSGASDTLACLRTVDYTTFLNAMNSLPGDLSYRSVDLAYLPRPDPSDSFFSRSPSASLQQGKYVKVPIIVGDQEDEGTLFSLAQTNVSTNAQLIDYLTSYFPQVKNARQIVTNLLSFYPDDPLGGQPDGSPYRTGPLNNIYPQYKRLAAVLGDITFTLTRRIALQGLTTKAGGITAWSYLNSYLYGTPVVGTLHGSDVLVDYGTLTNAIPATAQTQQYYINFVYNLDPNKGPAGNPALLSWPKYTPSSPMLLHFEAASTSLLPDTFRSNASDYVAQYGGDLAV